MRKTLTTAALLLALCCPVLAGEINAPPAPPPPPQSEPRPTAEGEMHTPPLVEFALTLLALF